MNESNSAESEAPRRPAPRQGWREIGRSLAHRNFRLFFAGQTISLLGTWMQSTAMTWLVYRLSKEQDRDSAFLLGITSFAGQIPVLLSGARGRRVERPLEPPTDHHRHAGPCDAPGVPARLLDGDAT